MIARTSESLKSIDWMAEVANLTPRTLLDFADAHSVRPATSSSFSPCSADACATGAGTVQLSRNPDWRPSLAPPTTTCSPDRCSPPP